MSEESERAHDAAADPHAGEADGVVRHAVHLPPPSWAPIVVALSLAVVFVGLLGEIRDAVGPAMWIVGLLGLIGGCASWARSARTEYLELPEEPEH